MGKLRLIALIALIAAGLAAPALAGERLRLATTTSTENTGLLDVLLPPFEKANGVEVDVVAVGTGKALAMAGRCDADVLVVHAPKQEAEFVAKGLGLARIPLMHNYFVIVGPADDPAGAAKAASAPEALAKIKAAGATFVSRGDNSGTNIKELELWRAAGQEPRWDGYREAGQGMGQVLTMADQMKAYTLSDEATYAKYKSVGRLSLAVIRANDPSLKNPYSVIVVNPANCPNVKAKLAQALADYLTSAQGQAIIAGFEADGQKLFQPAAK